MKLLPRGLIVRPMLARPRRLFVSISGIAIGVAAVAAIHRANQSVTRSFRDAVDVVAGRTDLSVSGIDGVPESAGARLAWLWDAGGSFAPIVDRFAVAADGTDDPVQILGIDVTSEAPVRAYRLIAPRSGEGMRRLFERDTVFAPLPFVRRHHLKLGSRLDLFAAGRRRSVTIAAILDLDGPARASGGSVLVTGLRTAQMMFGIEGRVDRIDVRLPESSDRGRMRSRIGAGLAPGLSVAPPQTRSETAGKMVRAFRFNLAALGSIALLVGMFLIYNTVSLSVLRRRSEIGTLRALGASKGAIFRAFLLEGTLLGAAGTLVGLAVGALLSKAALAAVGGTVENIYAPTATLSLSDSPAPFLVAAASGFVASIFAALHPAAEAASVDPASTMRAGSIEAHRRRECPLHGGTALGLCILGAATCLLPAVAGFPLFGFAAIGCGVAALAAVSGPAVFGFERLTRRVWAKSFGAPGRLASSFFSGNASRNSVAVAALALSLGMTAAMAVMIASLRATVATWMSQSATADLMIKSATGARRGVIGTLPPEAIEFLRSVPGVAAADPFRALESADEHGNPFTIGSGDFDEARKLGGLPLLSHRDSSRALSEARHSGSIFVSEPFARKFGKWRGDAVTLTTPAGPRTFRVEDVYFDYSNDRGMIVMDRPAFLALFGDAAVSTVAIAAAPGVTAEELRGRILAASRGRFAFSILTSTTLRREVTRIFDRTFAVTWALEAIAMAVAVLGVFHALIALTLERQRELSLLKVLGTSRGQMARAIVLEAALLALAALCLAAAAAAAFATVLIKVINRQAFGWTVRTAIPWTTLGAAFLLIFVATLAASALPARLALAIDPARGMREE